MTAPPLQQQLTPGDHHYFEWSTSKQQTNHTHPLMPHNHYYQHLLDGKTTVTPPLSLSPTSNHPNDHIRKKQKLNGSLNTSNDQNPTQQQVKILS